MSGGSRSKSSQSTANTDNRVGASDSALAIGANSEIAITTADPGVLDFGGQILDFGRDLVALADSSTKQAGETAGQAVGLAANNTEPADKTTASLLTTVSVAAIAAYALTRVAR